MDHSLSANSLSGLSGGGGNSGAVNSGSASGRIQSSMQQGASGTNPYSNSAGSVNINNGSNEISDHDTSQEEIRGLSCQICYQNFSREGEHVPRNLQCGHTYCTSCLDRLVGQYCIGTVRCPTCKHETLINGFMDDVNQLPKNFGVLEIISAQEEDSQRQGRKNPTMPKRPPPKPPNGQGSSRGAGASGGQRGGSSTGDGNEAVGFAVSSNYDISSYEQRCQEHEGEPMKVYCKTCCQLICIYCQVYGSHANHSCELVSQTAEAGRREVISRSENLDRSKDNLLLARQIIIETISAVRHKEEKTIREVTHHFDTMRKRVHKREGQLKDMVKCKTSQKIAALESQERTISDLIDRCEVTQRICTRSLTEDDVTVVQEKDVLIQEMSALSDISSDCELAPVCIDNILCHLPRDAFDVIMIHGTVEEACAPLGIIDGSGASSSRHPDNGFGDRNWLGNGLERSEWMPNPPSLDLEMGSSGSRPARRASNQRQRGRFVAQTQGNSNDRIFPGVGGPVPQMSSEFPSMNARTNRAAARHRSASHQVRSQQRELNASFSSTDMEQIRSSLEEALRAVQSQQFEQSHDEGIERNGESSAASQQSAREAAAQAAIKRSQITQNLVQSYMNAIQPSLQRQGSQDGRTDNVQLNSNLTTIQSAMQEIQSAVTNARATLEESMNQSNSHSQKANGTNSSSGSSSTQQASPDSASFDIARPSVQSGDEDADDGRIYEQVSDGEVEANPPASQASIGQVLPDTLQQHPMSELGSPGYSEGNRGDESPLYHVYGSAYHTVNPSPNDDVNLHYNSDSSEEPSTLLPNPDDIYDGPYYSCDCGDTMSCSCSECNSADEEDDENPFLTNHRARHDPRGSSSHCRQRQFFNGIPSHLDLNSSLESQAALQLMNPTLMHHSHHRFRNDVPVEPTYAHYGVSSSRDQNQNGDVGTMTKLLNRMNLMKSKKNGAGRKKHHHKSSTPSERQRETRNAESQGSSNLVSGANSCAPFFLTPNRCVDQGVSTSTAASATSASNSAGGARPKTTTTQKRQKLSKKQKTAAVKTPRSNEKQSQHQLNDLRGGSVESLLQTSSSRAMQMQNEPRHNSSHSSLLNSLPKCANAASGSCMSGEPALFICSFCQKKYCHICAVHAAGKKCSKKPNKTHSIVALDEDLSEDATANSPNANLNVPKNPQSVSHTFMIKCTNCGDVSEFVVNCKTCKKCHAELQVDLNLYNPCPNCDLLNSKDAIACELCSSDIIPIN